MCDREKPSLSRNNIVVTAKLRSVIQKHFEIHILHSYLIATRFYGMIASMSFLDTMKCMLLKPSCMHHADAKLGSSEVKVMQ